MPNTSPVPPKSPPHGTKRARGDTDNAENKGALPHSQSPLRKKQATDVNKPNFTLSPEPIDTNLPVTLPKTTDESSPTKVKTLSGTFDFTSPLEQACTIYERGFFEPFDSFQRHRQTNISSPERHLRYTLSNHNEYTDAKFDSNTTAKQAITILKALSNSNDDDYKCSEDDKKRIQICIDMLNHYIECNQRDLSPIDAHTYIEGTCTKQDFILIPSGDEHNVYVHLIRKTPSCYIIIEIDSNPNNTVRTDTFPPDFFTNTDPTLALRKHVQPNHIYIFSKDNFPQDYDHTEMADLVLSLPDKARRLYTDYRAPQRTPFCYIRAIDEALRYTLKDFSLENDPSSSQDDSQKTKTTETPQKFDQILYSYQSTTGHDLYNKFRKFITHHSHPAQQEDGICSDSSRWDEGVLIINKPSS